MALDLLFYMLTTALRTPLHLHLISASKQLLSNQYFRASITTLSNTNLYLQAAQPKKNYTVRPPTTCILYRANLSQVRASSHGKRSSLDSGQESLISLLHPRRWRSDAIDSLSSHPANPDSRCAGTRVYSWRQPHVPLPALFQGHARFTKVKHCPHHTVTTPVRARRLRVVAHRNGNRCDNKNTRQSKEGPDHPFKANQDSHCIQRRRPLHPQPDSKRGHLQRWHRQA
jgi:hypothetical protein